MATKTIKLAFGYERQTPGAVRYKEITPDAPLIGTLYFRKTAFAGSDYPDEVEVEISISASQPGEFKPVKGA